MINRAEAGSRRRRCPFSAGLWARPASSPLLSPQLPLGLPRAQLLGASALPARPPVRPPAGCCLTTSLLLCSPRFPSGLLRTPSHTSRAAALGGGGGSNAPAGAALRVCLGFRYGINRAFVFRKERGEVARRPKRQTALGGEEWSFWNRPFSTSQKKKKKEWALERWGY